MGESLARQALTVLTGRGLVRLSLFLAFLIIARFLTPEEFGWFGIVTTAVALAATMGSLGLRQSFAYEIGQRRLTAEKAALLGLVLWPVLSAFSSAVVLFFLWPSFPGDQMVAIAVVLSVSVFGALLLTMLQGVSLGRGDIKLFTSSETLPRVALLVGVVVLALVGTVRLLSVLWAQAIGYVLAALLLVFLILRARTDERIGLDFRSLPRMLRYGLIFALNLFLITLISRISMFVIQIYWSAEEAGHFFAAVRVTEIFLELATAVGMVLFSSAARADDGVQTVERTARLVGWMVWMFVLLAILIYFTAPWLVRIVLGEPYMPAAPALQVLAFTLVPAAASKLIYPTIAGAGKPYFGTPLIAGTVFLGLVLSIIWVPAHGAVGGAWALVGSQCVLFFGYVLLCGVKFRIPLRLFLFPDRADFSRVMRGLKRKMRRS